MSRRDATARKPDTSPAEDDVILSDLEAIKAVADPVRLQLLLRLVEPQTVRQIAESLDVPTTRLYYHVRILESHGLIRVVRRRKVSGIVEKTYQSVGTSWTLSPDLAVSSLESTGALSALLDLVHAELSIALEESPGATAMDLSSGLPLLGLTPLALSEGELASFQERIGALLEDFACRSPVAPPGKSMYHLFVAGYPVRSPRAARD